jgi:hypothetical protein
MMTAQKIAVILDFIGNLLDLLNQYTEKSIAGFIHGGPTSNGMFVSEILAPIEKGGL